MQASSIEVAEERDAQRQQALRNALPVHLRDIVDLGLSKDKGCVLIARRAFEIGDLIFEEDPLLFVSPSAYAQSTIDLLQAICREANLSALLSTASADDDHFVSVRTILPTLQFLREDADTQRKVLLMFCPPEPTVPPLFLRVLRHAIAALLARGVADPAAAAAAGRRHASSAAAVLERVALVCQCNIFAVTDETVRGTYGAPACVRTVLGYVVEVFDAPRGCAEDPAAAAHHRDDIAFVEALYRQVLAREPDPPGLAYWAKRADDGMARDDIRAAFAAVKRGP